MSNFSSFYKVNGDVISKKRQKETTQVTSLLLYYLSQFSKTKNIFV